MILRVLDICRVLRNMKTQSTALIKTVETLIERTNNSRHKNYYFIR